MGERNKERWFFWGILIGAVLVRGIGFVEIPAGVNQDEAMAGVDAWALSKYGTDRFGIYLPVHLTAWKYGQMSALLSYCMIPFIKIFGFGTLAVRLPMLLASCGSVALVYLAGKRLFNTRAALGLMALTAVNPWHFMQSRWSLDCNLFPHVFLLAFWLLLLGLEKRRYLYASMIFFGLTFYCYGVAVYSVTPFLAVFALWCLWKRQLKCREILLCIALFLLVALPEILVMAINFFGWSTIETPFFTMSYFPESIRSADILFLNFSFEQLGRNFLAMIRTCILQTPDQLYNSLPAFGPLYHISIPFMLLGAVSFTGDMCREKDMARKTEMLALWGFLLTGIWTGLLTFEVNVNRINIIYFPLIFMCGYGIWKVAGRWKRMLPFIGAAYAVCFGLFLGTYFTTFAGEIGRLFNVNFLEAVKEADGETEYARLYITGNMDWQYNLSMAEILTHYACEIDAAYYQEKTNYNGGRELLPYSERYHFINVDYEQTVDAEGLYLIHISELDRMPFAYRVLKEEGNYYLLVPAEPE
nr:glycosyltransferase family 39 protein [uncultured Acetatifactor sp.]